MDNEEFVNDRMDDNATVDNRIVNTDELNLNDTNDYQQINDSPIKSTQVDSQSNSIIEQLDLNDTNSPRSSDSNRSMHESVQINDSELSESSNLELIKDRQVINETVNNRSENNTFNEINNVNKESENDTVVDDSSRQKSDINTSTNVERQQDKQNDEIKEESETVKKDEENDKPFNEDDIEEGSGFPKCFEGWVIRGKTIPINKKTFNSIEVDGNDSIIDCVSQVVPILLKKPNIFPPKYENVHSNKKNDTKKSDKSEEKDEDNIKEEKSNETESKTDETNQNESTNEANKKVDDKSKLNSETTLMISNYFDSSVGNFLMNIGLTKCKEALHKDGMRQAQRLIRKEGERAEYVEELNKQSQLYHEYKRANSIYTFNQLSCAMCDFKTESEVVLEGHYLTPHLSNKKEFKCNFCVFVTRDVRVIQYHFQVEHKKYPTIQMPPHLYECPTCNYESNQKSKAANHVLKCAKITENDKIHETAMPEHEYPAITPRPISQDDLRLYDSTTQALKPVVLNPSLPFPDIPGFPKALQQQILLLLQQQYNQQKMKYNKTLQTKLTNHHNNTLRQFQQQSSIMSNLLLNNNLNANTLILNNSNLFNNLSSNLSNLNNLNSFAKASPNLYKMLQGGSQMFNKNVASSSISPMNLNSNLKIRPPVQQIPQQLSQQSKPNIKGLLQTAVKPSSSKDMNTSSVTDNKTFVICEICDGYIKDLEELRTHMSRQHKVKIHPKMIASRPPLNCQKCQWRFFTDQGLERHLLGGHGLVTSNMQDLVDQDQDGGRCTICGRIFNSKLVAHMSQIHKKTLRPAHLSYKCTVCSATFNLYRLFESHVYMVHSNVKRSNDNETNSIAKKVKTMDLKMNGI